MPFQRPTLAELVDRNSNEISSRLGIGKLLARSVLYVFARVFAGLSHMLHGHLDWIAKQLLPDTATGIWLDRHGSLHSVYRKAATSAVGLMRFTGSGTSTIPAGTSVQTVDGVRFTTDSSAQLSGQQADVAVTAVEAGLDGNTPIGATLSLTSPVAGIDNEGVVLNDGSGQGIHDGTDQETDERLRERILLKLRNPPQGGSVADYIQWTLEVPGVTRPFVKGLQFGAGTVGVTFAVDDDPGGPVPSPTKVTEVQDYLDDDSRRPVTADVQVFQPTALPMDPDISLVPNTAEVQAAVEAALNDLILREGGPSRSISIAAIREAISTAPGETGHTLNFPTSTVTASDTELHTLGAITWS